MAEVESKVETEEKEISLDQTEKQTNNDNFRYRLERAKEQGMKQVLKELNVSSMDEVRTILERLEEEQKNRDLVQEMTKRALSAEKTLEIIKSGFDEKYAKFIAHELDKSKDFKKDLSKFKEDNPHFLRNQNAGIKISTSPNFEKKNESKDLSARFNEFVLQKLHKE